MTAGGRLPAMHPSPLILENLQPHRYGTTDALPHCQCTVQCQATKGVMKGTGKPDDHFFEGILN
jgi:hypothetical protein